MLKKSILLISALFLLASCSGEQAQNEAAEATVAAMTIAEFNTDGEAYEGKLVEVTGTVDHVCKHSGKRMFIVGDDPADRIKIEAGDVGTFDMGLQGSKVKVVAVGTVMKLDNAYLDNWAKEAGADDSLQNCSEEQKALTGGEEEFNTAMEQINELRRQVAESEKGYLPILGLEAKSFEEI